MIIFLRPCLYPLCAQLPSSINPRPPPPEGRKPAPAALRALVRECIEGKFPLNAVSDAYVKLPEGSGAPSRFVPSSKVVAKAQAYENLRQRGGSIDDATRCDLLVRKHLIQRDLVLLYNPGVILVMATPWSLELAREHGVNFVTTDAKVDTVTGARIKWTSIRCKKGPLALWIAPEENSETIEMGATALAVNLRCSQPGCSHSVITSWAHGSYCRTLSCQRWWRPSFCIDKHIPSFRGLAAAGYGHAFLCDFHGFKCIGDFLSSIGVRGAAADASSWAFRLIKRAASRDQAFDLRDDFVRFHVRHAGSSDQRLWNLEQAEQIVSYNDKCWMYPNTILNAWIDADGLSQ